MAADGAWPAKSESGDASLRRSLAEVRSVLARLEAQLSAQDARALSPVTAAALVQGLSEIAARLGAQAAAAGAETAGLSGAVKDLAARRETAAAAPAAQEARIEAQLTTAAAESALREASPADPGPIRAVLGAAAACAAMAVTGAGVLVLDRSPVAAPILALEAEHMPGLRSRAPSEGLASSVVPRVPQRSPGNNTPATDAPRRGEAGALPRLTGLAQAGDAEAQLQLAGLYEAGEAGLPRDLAAARLWTRRAANGGHRVAMHNLGLFLMEGEGGLRDVAEAAGWFRRAADKGVVDSQYNLGLLYEAGRGVPQDLREAYRWFAIAANAGDLAARGKQLDLEARLSAGERTSLDRDAARYRPLAAQGEPDPIVPPATSVAETQALLARRGYYVGPLDGVTSPALKAAASAWLRDHPGVDPGS